MRTAKSICLALFVLTGLLDGVRGENYRTDINPALLYYQSFLLAPKGQDWDKESQYLVTNNWEGQHLPEQFGLIISNFTAELELTRQAAHQTVPCDWGIDLSRGANTLLPQLARAKSMVLDSEDQIIWDLQNGNQAEARDDLVADLALGRNISRNRTLISTLVEIAIESSVCGEIAENFNHFSPETLQQLAYGFDAAPPRGTVAECTATEKPIRDWFISQIENIQKQYPDDNAAAMNGLHHLFYYYPADEWERLTNGTDGTIDGLIRAIRNAEPLHAQLGALMALPYDEYGKQLPRQESQFQQSGNPYFLHSLPAWEASRRREFAIEVGLAMVRAAIQYKLHGEAGLESVKDPCGSGPFTMKRFIFNGVNRGFELTSPFSRGKGPMSYIFVEKDGPPFYVTGNNAGQPISK
jgi:hypothetical protein